MMMNALKISLGCLFIALALNVVFSQILAPTTAFDIPWLQINTTTHRPGDKWQNPEFTVIYSSAIPIVTRLSPTRWQITFQSK